MIEKLNVAVTTRHRPYLPKTGRTVGINLGLKNFATTSAGEMFNLPDFKAQREKLDQLSDELRQQEPGSEAWENQ